MKHVLLISCFLSLCLTGFPHCAAAATQWSLSVVEGYYFPRLDDLNYLLRHEEVELGPRNTEAKPNPYPVIYQGFSPDNMPDMKPVSPKVGLQVQADITPVISVVFGGSTTTLDSSKRDERPFFVGFVIPASRETRFALILNQIWLGARRYWVLGDKTTVKEPASSRTVAKTPPSPEKPRSRFFVGMGVLAVTRAYLTTDVWLHVYAPDEGFDFYKVVETGISGSGFATYVGAGGEYYIKRWLSVGLDVDYTLGGVSEMRFTRYFTVDPLEEGIIKRGDIAFYTDLKKGVINPLTLDLEGWDLKGQVKFYF